MTVNKELGKLWIDTLRSGEYQQGTATLKSIDNKFCCLGVLCDIAKQQVNLDWELEDPNSRNYLIGDTCTVLPTDIINLLGVNSDRIIINKNNSKLQEYLADEIDSVRIHTTLVALNDYHKLDFNQIADILEEEFLLSGTINEDETINVA